MTNSTGSIVVSLSMSLDGFSAGPDVAVERPMGEGGERLHEWLFQGDADPSGVDTRVAQELSAVTGAVVLGRRTFDVGVGLWQDTPFPVPSFVLTHEVREQQQMKSAAFTFVTDGIGSALRQARAAAVDKDVLVMGGARTAQQAIAAGLADEIQIQLVPVLLGSGVRLFDQLGTEHIELERTRVLGSPHVTHLRFRVRR
ncbi:MAG: dihydrofolate reductase [Hamadaea sp.]|uniref:dihydrofolate reductase family protein n=1 Tax=Hamadaea sp. TaxID=2024425 RepID=UPI0017DA29CE|nr:dihydrofolate reductase family protein [Hamadaea sp.]NUR69473.1 dihydrofolate reductase [Hamadaea sp.]NUT20709.1 dihydrofolate reductase [Hamadaea sp.]